MTNGAVPGQLGRSTRTTRENNANEGGRSRARLHAPRSLQLRKYLGEPPMEGINIMPGSIRPVSANYAAGMVLKEAMGCKMEKEREKSQQREKEGDEKESREWSVGSR